MASRYVPPHLRRKADALPDDLVSRPEEIDTNSNRAGQRRLSDLPMPDHHRSPTHTLSEIQAHFGSSTINSTLHDSVQCPGELAFVVLFRNANPRWQSEHVIFAHTNIDFLPGYAQFRDSLEAPGFADGLNLGVAGTSPSKDEPNKPATALATATKIQDSKYEATSQKVHQQNKMLPVFLELRFPRGVARRYAFHGFFTIADIQFLRPQSQDLIHMLQQKWDPSHTNSEKAYLQTKQRDQAAWKKSLSQEWAVIKMSRPPRATWPQEPLIEIIPDVPQEEQGRTKRKEEAFLKRSGYESGSAMVEE